MSTAWFALGLVIVLLNSASMLSTIVLPREPHGFARMSYWVVRVVQTAFVTASKSIKSYERKDGLLAAAAPVALLGQLAAWGGLYVLGYGLMTMGVTRSFGDSLLQATGSLFTVGTVNLGGGIRDNAIDIACGATWVIVVTLQISYLPTLYQAFARRESLVAMLESRAGVPAWGPEVLARHQLVEIIDALPGLYEEWERWSAELAESHTTYPVLLLFRSPDPWYSWLVGLMSVLDAAALHLAIAPSTASSQSRLCLRMGFTALHRLARMQGWPVNPDPKPEDDISLTFEEFEEAVQILETVDFPIERSAEDAWADFKGWRVNYEEIAYRMCDAWLAPPAPWTGRRHYLGEGEVAPRRPPQRRPARTAPIRRVTRGRSSSRS